MDSNVTKETLELIKQAMGAPNADLAKAWTQSASAISGITAYDLQAPALRLYPVITPLRNEIPRVSGKGGIQANWRAVTGINTTQMRAGVSQGNRGAVITSTTADYTAAYKGLGLEDSVTFEADYAAEGFDDVKALAIEGLLRAMMIEEEKIILGGNASYSLANTPTPTLSSANTGGSLLTNVAYGVGVVALTFDGYRLASLTTGIVQSYVRTNADASTDTVSGGTALPSAQANVTTANSGGNAATLNMSVTPVSGAVGYAWFWGLASGNLTLGAITSTNSNIATALPTGTASGNGIANFAALAASNKSTDSLVFDGLLTFAMQPSLGSYQGVMPSGTPGIGTPLTGDGSGGIVEIDAALRSFWDNYRLSPDTLWVNSQEMNNIGKKILAGSSNSAQRFVFNAEQGMVGGGIMVRTYLNKFSMDGATELKIRLHPNMPPGTMLFTTARLPYPLSNVTNVLQMRMRRDYYQIEWPQTTRKYQYGIYEDGVLQDFFPPSQGILTNIANG